MRAPDYTRYYWKNDLIRLRLATMDGWESHFYNYFDSESRFLLDAEIELPPDVGRSKRVWAEFVSPDAKHGRTVFAIENAEGKTVGTMNLYSVDQRNGTFSLGIQINVDERGNGYGTAAMRMVMAYAFRELRLHKCNSGYINIKGNVASQRMHEKLGFKVEGIIRESVYHNGKYWDDVRCGITDSEFFANDELCDNPA